MDNHWKKLSFGECEYTKKCIQELESCSWAKGLIKKFNNIKKINNELPTSCMPFLFEIRFAYALYKAGLNVQNEYKCSTKYSEIKDSNVDFLVTEINSNRWFIELTSLDESKYIKENTRVNGNMQSYVDKDL